MPELSKKTDTRVNLYVNNDGETGLVLKFPVAKYGDGLPSLVRVRSAVTGKTLIAGTGVWGNPNMPPEADAVRVPPGVTAKLQRSGEAAAGRYHAADVRTARLADLAIHQKGLGAPIVLALVVCLGALAGAVATFVTSQAPVGLTLAGLCLVSLASLGTAGRSINDKLKPS